MAYGFFIPYERFIEVTIVNKIGNAYGTKSPNICFRVCGEQNDKQVFLYWDSCFEHAGIAKGEVDKWDGSHLVSFELTTEWMKSIEATYNEDAVFQLCRGYHIPVQPPKWDIILTRTSLWNMTLT